MNPTEIAVALGVAFGAALIGWRTYRGFIESHLPAQTQSVCAEIANHSKSEKRSGRKLRRELRRMRRQLRRVLAALERQGPRPRARKRPPSSP